MTGWAVVHGRNDVPISTRRDLDTWYADHAGFAAGFEDPLEDDGNSSWLARESIEPQANRFRRSPAPGVEAQRCSTEN